MERAQNGAASWFLLWPPRHARSLKKLFELLERFVSLAYSCGSSLQNETIATVQPAI